MAYRDKCEEVLNISCPRIGRWSNPADTSQQGLPLGAPLWAAEPAHDAKALNANRTEVANYRLSACRLLSTC